MKSISCVSAWGLFWVGISSFAHSQTIPNAPETPVCTWRTEDSLSNCKFKDAVSGTPTSVAGNRVVVFRRSANGGHGESRKNLDSAVSRLAKRYGFTATISEDPAIFADSVLANTKVVIMSNGDGDVIPAGKNRIALENFQQVHGWGVIWIHAACSFITTGWPFGQQSCVQQYFHHNPSGTERRIFIDSGTTAMPNQGRKNPQSEFLLRKLPSWTSNASPTMKDEWFCFQAPARNTAGVNVLFGYDRSSGLPDRACPLGGDSSETASAAHNLAWTHPMGKGITIVNSFGQNEEVYTDNNNAGDSLLWRYIRYAAKDWCVSESNSDGCNQPSSGIQPLQKPSLAKSLTGNGSIQLTVRESGNHLISVKDVFGRRVAERTLRGPGQIMVPGLQRGIYHVRIRSKAKISEQRVMVY